METAPQSIASLNALPPEERERRYGQIIPRMALERYGINPDTFADVDGNKLFTVHGEAGAPTVELDLRSTANAPDPLFYGHFTDTTNGLVMVMLVVISDPDSPRYDVDRMPDGTPTDFGTSRRNLVAEEAARQAGLAPGQIHTGLRAMPQLMENFENFLTQLGHTMYLVEPLKYHTSVLFERYGLAYEVGRRWMQSINTRFSPGGDLRAKLDGSTPFRLPHFADSVLGRSWAIHDGILGEPYNHVRMYKHIGKSAGICTTPVGLKWQCE